MLLLRFCCALFSVVVTVSDVFESLASAWGEGQSCPCPSLVRFQFPPDEEELDSSLPWPMPLTGRLNVGTNLDCRLVDFNCFGFSEVNKGSRICCTLACGESAEKFSMGAKEKLLSLRFKIEVLADSFGGDEAMLSLKMGPIFEGNTAAERLVWPFLE